METTATESKADAYRRLLQEKRWEEASAYRHAKRHEFREQGESTADSKELAWAAMIEHFPPTDETLARIQQQEEERATKQAARQKPAETSPVSERGAKFVDPAAELDGDPNDPESIASAELDELVARTKDKEVDFEADLLWAYRHMGMRSIRPKDAPSYGAWSQLDYARKDKPKFMETVNKTLGKAVIERRKNRQDDSMDQYEMLRTFQRDCLKMSEEEIAASVSA